MPQVLIRDVDTDVIDQLKSQAKASGQSLNTFLRHALQRQAQRKQLQQAINELDRLRALTPAKEPDGTTAIIRDMRDGKDSRF
jgi:hypothetical protein